MFDVSNVMIRKEKDVLRKFLIVLTLNILMLFNNQTYAKYVFRYQLDVATLNTGGNYYLITYNSLKALVYAIYCSF